MPCPWAKPLPLIVAAVLALGPAGALMASEEAPQAFLAAIVVEPSTMTVLYEKNARESLPTASMIKMLTLLVVLDALEEGEIRWQQRVEVSKNVERVRGTGVYLEAGEVHRVSDLVRATMVHSANDAAVALAEAVSGSEEEFVERMRRKARALGLEGAEIHTASGLPTSETGRPLDRMTAWDLAILGAAVQERPEIMALSRTKTAPFPGRKFVLFNPNHLLRQYPYATGLKTGYTREAKFCLTASARRCDMDLIAVVIGCPNRMERFATARRLLEDAFSRYRLVEGVAVGEILAEGLPVGGGKGQASLRVAAAREVRWLVPWDEEPQVERELVAGELRGPLWEGEPVGTLIVRDGDRVIDEVPVVAAETLLMPSLWERLGQWLSTVWSSLGKSRA